MEGYALLCLPTVEKIDCHPVSSQRHSYLVLHCFCKTQESLVKLHCWLIRPLLLVNHSKVEGQMCFFLDILSAHPCLCSHQQLSQCAFLAGQQWHRRSISWSWTDGGSNGAVGHIRWLNSDLFFVEIHRTARFKIRKVFFKQFDAFVIMLSNLSFLHFFHFFLVGWSSRPFFKLQQSLVILAYLFGKHNLLALRFLLDLAEHLLPWLQEDLLEILHIALLSA